MSVRNVQLPEALASRFPSRTPSERAFGLTAAGVLVAVAIWAWRVHSLTSATWCLAGAATLVAMAIAAPRALRRANFVWTRLGHLLQWLVSPVLLALMFFLVLTPIAVLRRAARQRHAGTGSRPSYWLPRADERATLESLRNQF